jgi:hypothetical protein
MPAITSVIGRLYKCFGVVAHNWWAWGGPGAALAPVDKACCRLFRLPSTATACACCRRKFTTPRHGPLMRRARPCVLLCRGLEDEPVYAGHGRGIVTERELWHGGMLDSIFGFAYEGAQACLAE